MHHIETRGPAVRTEFFMSYVLSIKQASIPTRLQPLQQARPGQLFPEGRGHVSLQHAQHEGPGGGQEVWEWLRGGRRTV